MIPPYSLSELMMLQLPFLKEVNSSQRLSSLIIISPQDFHYNGHQVGFLVETMMEIFYFGPIFNKILINSHTKIKYKTQKLLTKMYLQQSAMMEC